MINTILWDFNGTVMDDMSASVGAVNAMLARRGLAPIDEAWYVKHLIMPLEDFYSSVGFDMKREQLAEVSEEFQRECQKFPRPVFPEVMAALERFRARGLRQLLFSSLHHSILIHQAEERGISDYFETIEGRQDRSLGGKEQAVGAYLKAHGIDPQEVLVVGDLITDKSMADHIGSCCALIARGHQHRSVLEPSGAYVLDSAEELDHLLEDLK